MQDNQNTVEAVADLMVECLPSSLEGVDRCSLLSTAEALIAAMRAAEPAGEAKPVAVIGKDWSLLWASAEPLSNIVRDTGIAIGSPLYAHPAPTDQSALVAELVEGLKKIKVWTEVERRWAEDDDQRCWIKRDDFVDALIARARQTGGADT